MVLIVALAVQGFTLRSVEELEEVPYKVLLRRALTVVDVLINRHVIPFFQDRIESIRSLFLAHK